MALKLARKLITGNTYVSDDVSGVFPMQTYTGSVPSGYEDISTITNWDLYYDESGESYRGIDRISKDYKFVRNEIKSLVIETAGATFSNWSGLSDDEKKIAAKYVCCPISKVIEQYGADTQLVLDEYDANSTMSRHQRYQAARMYVFEKMALTDAKNVLKDAGTTVELYLGGIEGTVEDGGIDGLFDYIQARTQSSHYTTGFATQSYTPITGSVQDVVDGIMDILENGNY